MARDGLDARRTHNRDTSNGEGFGFGCVPVIVFIGAVTADLSTAAMVNDMGYPSWLRTVPIMVYVVVIGLVLYGYYRRNLPWGALFSGLQYFSIIRICSMLGLAKMLTHLIHR